MCCRKEGDDWQAKAAGVTTELIFVAEAGGAILSMFTPVGWVAVVGAAIAEGAALTFLGSVAGSIAEHVYKGGEVMFHWAEKELKHWL